MLEWILLAVACNWLLPILLTLTFASVMTWVFKDYVFEGVSHGLLCFRLVNEGKEEDELGNKLEPWHVKLWLDWAGMALPGVMFYRDRPGEWDDKYVERTKKHEGTHGLHMWILGGILFFLIYFSHMLWIFVTQKIKGQPYTKHAYYDCWSERLARKAAGQTVDIPPEDWSWGKKDLWPWW
jgi:hypothetical protein